MQFENILGTIGHTPVVKLKSFSARPNIEIFAKLEGVNPTGSIKDRIARKMIEDAESQQRMKADSILMEPTSGNTGVSLALVAHMKGYPFTAVISDKGTEDKRKLLQLYGADLIVSPGAAGSNGAIRLAQEVAAQDKRYVMLYQYGNEANASAHYETTGLEIVQDIPDVNVFVAGLGTGGTLTGTGRRLKEYNPNIRVIGAEPMAGDSIQGLRNLSEGFVPPVLDLSVLDDRILVSSQDAWRRTRQLKAQEGIFAGPSSGAALEVALRVADMMDRGKIVIILADGGWKYMSEARWTADIPAMATNLAVNSMHSY
jgi:[CysO sulfur-carrier protein]-thiocarboxylate-dependent cysteine synthase